MAQSCAQLDALIDSANPRKVVWHSSAEWLGNFGDLNEERALIPVRGSFLRSKLAARLMAGLEYPGDLKGRHRQCIYSKDLPRQ